VYFDAVSYLRPQPLELTATDELVAVENIEILRQNGFEIDADEGDTMSGKAHRLSLVAQPVSKSTVFDMKGRHVTSIIRPF
jgi:DNA mismatch repair protein PMS2